MNDQPLSNDQVSDLGDFTVGNDGCTIIMDQTVNSPTPSSDSPMPSSVRGRRNTIRDLFKGTFFDEFKFEDSPEYSVSLQKVLLNGKDILALRQEDLERMSIDEAKNLLFQIHFEGNLRKKGFRGLQMWKRRYFRILGSTLIYFDVSPYFLPRNLQVNNLKVARRTSEITADGKVMVENIPDHPYAFSIIPNKSERLYNVEAYSTQQRVMIPFLPHSSQDQWIRLISLIIALNRRIYAPNPNSRRSIHDSFRILDTLGKGRYGVVHLGQQISTGEVFAIKVIHRGNIDASVLRQELLVLRAVKNRIHSEHIARIVDIYEDPLLVHIVMEYLGGGDLYHRVAKKGCFSGIPRILSGR